jgi:hypothetical protein
MRPDPRFAPGVPRAIVGFRVDDEGHWAAVLACGHSQHVRHDPPWQVRPWVLTESGRRTQLGVELACVRCRDGEPVVPLDDATQP